MDWIMYFLVFYFGACIGSFLNVVILRLPMEQTLAGRSHCVSCGRELSFLDLFPIFSFLFLAGKCRTCHHRISFRYPLIEFLAGSLFLFRWVFSAPQDVIGTVVFLRDLIFISGLISVFVIDLEHYLILDKILAWFGVPILALSFYLDISKHVFFWQSSSLVFQGVVSGIGLALVFLALWIFSQGRWIGFGDVKLMIFLGLGLGWPAVFVAWLLSFFIGTAFSLPLLLSGKKSLSSKLPLGCFLAISSLLSLFWGNFWFKAYLNLLGF